MLVTINDFNGYSGNYEGGEEIDKLKELILESSHRLVYDYLRFNPEDEESEGESLIKISILRIATLMLMEAGENIGVSSKSFADSSRQFISYTNYKKYLDPLQSLRKVVF